MASKAGNAKYASFRGPWPGAPLADHRAFLQKDLKGEEDALAEARASGDERGIRRSQQRIREIREHLRELETAL